MRSKEQNQQTKQEQTHDTENIFWLSDGRGVGEWVKKGKTLKIQIGRYNIVMVI